MLPASHWAEQLVGWIHEAGATGVVVVTFESMPFVRAYLAETKVAWPILIDHDRTLYRGCGMHRGRLSDIWGLRTWWA